MVDRRRIVHFVRSSKELLRGQVEKTEAKNAKALYAMKFRKAGLLGNRCVACVLPMCTLGVISQLMA